ncbi:MAG: hypothetical protein HC924_15940, partial [Synechococcaceae cyanobacterium SM2_3_2]|nr:hypothetical protein [Synechococcaceae cyanobacterium SM2_3_2]
MTNRKDCPDSDEEQSSVPQVVPVVELSPPDPPVVEKPVPEPVDKFRISMAFTAKWEGGFVHDPVDLGGRTNLGVTQSTYDTYRRQKGLAPRDVKHLNKIEAEAVYKVLFWDPARCERCVLPLAMAYFDTCVNFGVNGGVRFLQAALGVKADGRWGEVSEAAFMAGNNKQTAIKMCEGRIAYRHQRVREN